MIHKHIIQSNKTLRYLERAREGKISEASRFGVGEIDDHLRFKKGNFIVVTGHANVGKTHTMTYLQLLHTLENGTKWLIYSSENEVQSLQRKLIEFLAGKPINQIDEQTFWRHHAFIEGHWAFIDSELIVNAFELLDIAREVYDAWEFQGMMIDPYNSLTIKKEDVGKGISTHEYHYEVTSHIRKFCKEFGITTILNTHPATQALRQVHRGSHEYANHTMPPMASDVEGGGKFVNRSDEFFVIHRYSQHPTDWIFTDIHVRKVKELESGGRPTPLDFPIRMESTQGNCGFRINGINLVTKEREIDGSPF
jgi:hypothetical protein